MSPHKIEEGYQPGIIGRIAELHGTYYNKHWGFGLFFEARVATDLSTFLQRYNNTRDGIWLVIIDDRIEGSIIIDGIDAGNKGAHLRWFIMSDATRGQGFGKKLITQAIEFCKTKRYQKIYLTTFEGLGAARHLYKASGFQLIKQESGDQWGTRVTEQLFELIL